MKLLLENWKKYINEGVMDDKPYRTDAQARKELENNIYTEDDSKNDIEKTVKDVLKDEGGAAGLDPIKKAAEDLELPEDFDLKDFLKGLENVGQHEDGDYILGDDKEIHINKEDLEEGIEIFLEAQDDVLEEKRRSKRGKGRKKKRKKKKGKKDACYHKVRARYDVWPSAYASGALVKCRKVGAKNWGNKSKKNESIDLESLVREEIENYLEERKKKRKKRKLTAKPSSETSLRDWFGRKGAKGKKSGWVDCNTCKTVRTKSGKKRKTCKACGRSGGEKRAKYPSCRPTPGACGNAVNMEKNLKQEKKDNNEFH